MLKSEILILGSSGQLGSELCSYAKKNNILISEYTHQQIDLNNTVLLKECFSRHTPKFVINAAAYTAVDKAETEIEAANQLNAYAAVDLAKLCSEYDSILIHPSTDYVFNGIKITDYQEIDIPVPLNQYGSSKLLGEQGIQTVNHQHIILRVSWLFGNAGKNFVKTILRLGLTQPEIKVVADQFGCPTATKHVSEVIFQLIAQMTQGKKFFGVYHYCDLPKTTWYHFAEKIIQISKIVRPETSWANVIPISTADFFTPAARPKNSVLSCDKIYQDYGIKQKSWEAALNDLITDLLLSSEG
mgnify:CR=1 FL=1